MPDEPQRPQELKSVQAWRDDLMLEEFPDGPYGATTNPKSLGKSSPWLPGQASTSANRDQNPTDSERKIALRHPPSNAASDAREDSEQQS